MKQHSSQEHNFVEMIQAFLTTTGEYEAGVPITQEYVREADAWGQMDATEVEVIARMGDRLFLFNINIAPDDPEVKVYTENPEVIAEQLRQVVNDHCTDIFEMTNAPEHALHVVKRLTSFRKRISDELYDPPSYQEDGAYPVFLIYGQKHMKDIVTFKTEPERRAFLMGVAECEGWLDVVAVSEAEYDRTDVED